MVNKKEFKEDVLDIMRLRKKADGAEGLKVKALILFQLTESQLEDAYVAVARLKARYDCKSSQLAEKYKGVEGLSRLYDSIEVEILEALREHRHQDIQETYLFVLGKSGCDALAHYERKDFEEIINRWAIVGGEIETRRFFYSGEYPRKRKKTTESSFPRRIIA